MLLLQRTRSCLRQRTPLLFSTNLRCLAKDQGHDCSLGTTTLVFFQFRGRGRCITKQTFLPVHYKARNSLFGLHTSRHTTAESHRADVIDGL
jgi:hypothetical protein